MGKMKRLFIAPFCVLFALLGCSKDASEQSTIVKAKPSFIESFPEGWLQEQHQFQSSSHDGVVRAVNQGGPLRSQQIITELDLVIGKDNGPEEYILFTPTDILTDANNRILVPDGRRRSILVYDSGGNYLRSIGRKGEGPGEFISFPRLHLWRNGVLDAMVNNGRWQRWSIMGELEFDRRPLDISSSSSTSRYPAISGDSSIIFANPWYGYAQRDTSSGWWVYRKDRAPFETNTINVGVEGKFYSNAGDSEVDRIITEAEGTFAEAVDQLRTIPVGVVAPGCIPELLAHLEIRTRHLRQVFLRGGNYIATRLVDLLDDHEAFKDLLRRRMRRDPSLLSDAVRNGMGRHGASPCMLNTMLSLAKRSMPALMKQIDPYLTSLAEKMRADLPVLLSTAAKSGHIKALKQSVSPQIKVERYKPLSFHIMQVGHPGILLGDSAVVFLVGPPENFKAFLEHDDTIRAVLLPLSPDRLLIASCEPVRLDPRTLQQTIIRCSLEFFISAHRSDDTEELAADIGIDAELLSQSELEDIVMEVIRE